MPLTPLHPGVSLPFFIAFRRRLEIIPLVIGSMVSDLEILFMMPFTGWDIRFRGPMHSLIGAVSIDSAVALFISFAIFPFIGRWVKARYGKLRYHIFAGKDVTEAPKSFGAAAFSASLGALTHVLWDAWSHPYNPLLWPWDNVPGLNFAPPGDPFFVMLFSQLLTAMMLALLLEMYWRL
ncbi:MAG: DUF4184 family protein [Euryarchaeota archaeon]|nr:DUF4184 family protein [Euryarchaeota archaeon]